MKISFPERVPISWVTSFVGVLVAVEVLEGSDLLLALLGGAFLYVGALAFNKAGGLQYPSGSYIFFTVVITVGLGNVAKAVLGEPLQTNLLAPTLSMAVYFVGSCALYLAATLNTAIRPRKSLLADVKVDAIVLQIGIGCLIISAITPLFLSDSLQGTFSQFNAAFSFLAVMLPVYARARSTGGRKTFNVTSLLAWAFATFGGLHGFSKQGIFGPSFAWIVAAIAAGVIVSARKLIFVMAATLLAITFLSPYSQVGRLYRDDPAVNEKMIYLLEHPQETRELYERQSEYTAGLGYHWFDKGQGLMDRLTMFPIDDALIYYTDNGRPGSMYPILSYFYNVIPTFLVPDKPILRWGNYYAHQIGMLGEEDLTTGISFSPFSEAYHDGGWLGITVVACGMFLLAFYVCDWVAGSLKQNIWAVLYIVYFSLQAPEGYLRTTVYAATIFTISVISAAYISTKIAPIIGSFVVPAARSRQGNLPLPVSSPRFRSTYN